jgi:hypothetical protein
MGTSTHGWVEYRHIDASDADGDGWRALVNLQELLGGREPFAGCLFGDAETGAFEPIAPGRGVPSPMSRVAQLDYEDAPGDHGSWISLAELERVDWDATADLTAITSQADWERAVRRTEKFDRQGRLLDREVDTWSELPRDTVFALATEGVVEHDGHVYRAVPKRLRELAAYDWATLWSWLTELRDRWALDPENVRLVAWTVDG